MQASQSSAQTQTYLYDWGDASGRTELDYTVVHYDGVDGCLLCAYIMSGYQVQNAVQKENTDTYREVCTYPQGLFNQSDRNHDSLDTTQSIYTNSTIRPL